MRIGIISACFPPYFGWDSAAIRDYELSNLLKRNGHDVEVIALTNEESSTTRQDGMLVHRVAIRTDLTKMNLVPRTTPNALTVLSSRSNVWRQFLEVQKTQPYDVIDVPNLLWEGLLPGLFGLVPMVVRTQNRRHTYDETSLGQTSAFEFDGEVVSKMSRLANNLADASYGIQTVSECVDVERFSPTGEQALPDNYENTIAIRTRVTDEKIHQFITGVITAVAAEYPSTRFVVLAEDITSDDDEWHAQEKVKELIPEPGKVILTRAYHELLPELLRSAPICLVAPDCESGSYAWLEGMSCGRPLVIAQGAEKPDYLKDGDNALLVSGLDAAAAGAAIVRLRKDSALRERLSANAPAIVLERFNGAKQYEALVGIYSKAVADFKSPMRTASRAAALQDTLLEFESLVQSYDRMLYNLLFAESHRFKMLHWLNKLADSSDSAGGPGQKIAGKIKRIFGS